MEQKDRVDQKILKVFEIVEKLGEGGNGVICGLMLRSSGKQSTG